MKIEKTKVFNIDGAFRGMKAKDARALLMSFGIPEDFFEEMTLKEVHNEKDS